jgi:phage FluMu gp28-like protein
MIWFDSPNKGPRWVGTKKYFGEFPTKKEQDDAIEYLCRTYPVWFFEVLAELEGKPLVLERFQIDYLNDESRFKSTLKTRQAGGSMIVSAAKFWRAITHEYYRCDIVSSSLKEARYKIKYIKDFYDTIPIKWRPELTIDNSLSIGFHGGVRLSEVNSLAATSGIRGGRKDIFVDESAVVPKYDEFYTSAMPATIRGEGQFEQVFTPLGMSGKSWEIHTNQLNDKGKPGYDNFSRHEFGWWQVTPFSKNVDEATKRWEIDYDKDFAMMELLREEFATDDLATVIDGMTIEEFHQEFCARFVDEGEAYFSWKLINDASVHSEEQYSLNLKTGKEFSLELPYEPLWKSRPENANEVFVGIDFAEGKSGGDSTSIQIIERYPDGNLRHRAWFDLDYKTGYQGLDNQINYITNYIIPTFRPDRVRVDATGMGIYVKDTLVKKHGHLIDPVPFSHQSKEEMVTNVKACLETRKLLLCKDNKALAAQMHGIKRTSTPSGNWTYSGDKHDDMFWALALAVKGLGRTPFRIIGMSSAKKKP